MEYLKIQKTNAKQVFFECLLYGQFCTQYHFIAITWGSNNVYQNISIWSSKQQVDNSSSFHWFSWQENQWVLNFVSESQIRNSTEWSITYSFKFNNLALFTDKKGIVDLRVPILGAWFFFLLFKIYFIDIYTRAV